MCRPDDFPPYDSPEMPAPGYDAQTRHRLNADGTYCYTCRTGPYDGPRCEDCGGDHHPGREPLNEEDEPMTEQMVYRMACVLVVLLILGAFVIALSAVPRV